MTPDRVERAVQSTHGISISLTTMVVAAIGADQASSSFSLGGLSHVLLYASLGCFIISAIAGGHLVTRLPLIDGEIDEVMGTKAALIGGENRGILALKVSVWREVQHWGLITAILLGVAGGLATATAEELAGQMPNVADLAS